MNLEGISSLEVENVRLVASWDSSSIRKKGHLSLRSCERSLPEIGSASQCRGLTVMTGGQFPSGLLTLRIYLADVV